MTRHSATAGGLVGGGGIDPDSARDQARDILDQRRYEPADVPRPFEGVLEWLGDRLRPAGDLLDRLLSSWPGRAALLTGLVALVTVVAVTIARRRGVGAAVRSGSARGGIGEGRRDPAELERAADEAERWGDLDRALRLRFRAGLLRLDATGAIRFRPSLTSGEVRRRLHQPAFDELAVTFDEVAYGGRPASPADVSRARDGWTRVLTAAGRT
ncbi:MAG TPA: DUF4129 domain-containing protein [Acidimicrobiia bacterium]